MRLEITKLSRIPYFLVHFARNTIKAHSVLTLAETLWDRKSTMLAHFPRHTIKTHAGLSKMSSKLEINCILGPEVVPDEPGRPAGPAWPAGLTWPPDGLPWLAWLAVCPAGSGHQLQRLRPPTPITAGGLRGIRQMEGSGIHPATLGSAILMFWGSILQGYGISHRNP